MSKLRKFRQTVAKMQAEGAEIPAYIMEMYKITHGLRTNRYRVCKDRMWFLERRIRTAKALIPNVSPEFQEVLREWLVEAEDHRGRYAR